MPDYDAIVIGTGQAGPSLAHRLAAAGMKVAIVERGRFGGTCVNTGCTPTKTMVASAYAAQMARRGAEYGVSIAGAITVDMKRVKARRDAIVDEMSDGIKAGLDGDRELHRHEGHARFVSPKEVAVGTRPACGRSDLHQCRRTGGGAGDAGHRSGPLPDQLLDHGARFRAAAPRHHRRQLCRPRIRPDLPPLRQRGHHRRDGAASRRARGRGHVGYHPRHPRSRGHSPSSRCEVHKRRPAR